MKPKGTQIVAAADIGSNATKLLVWEIAPDRKVRELFQKRYPLRLDDAFRTGRIEPPSVARLIETFSDIAETCRRMEVERFKAAATEAFRVATNAEAVIREIAARTQIAPTIITAQQEGLMLALGVLLDHAEHAKDFLVLDVGGGSVQITAPHPRTGLMTRSLPLGAVRLREAFARADPLKPAEYKALHEHVEAVAVKGVAGIPAAGAFAIGCGGGVRFLHTMCSILRGTAMQDQPIRADVIDHLCQTIWPMPIDSLMRCYGLDRERAEIIIPGAVVVWILMKILKIKELRPSSRGVRDGLLAEFLRHGNTHAESKVKP